MTEATISHTKKHQFLSGSTLKIIAMITMLIDHLGAALLYSLPGCYPQNTTPLFNGCPFTLYELYGTFRNLGRIAFPIYCFLLVEGFFHTKSKEKYAFRLFLFALISEIPFDLAFNNVFFTFKMQNVFWTLFLGFVCMILLDRQNQIAIQKAQAPNVQVSNTLLIIFIFVGLATVFKTDYYGLGIILIAIFYKYHNQLKKACILGYFSFLWEPFCFPAFLLIPLYNGKKGLNLKYLFYLFYPLHLLLLYTLRLHFTT
ncbi:MAG: conjugal transfer protein TraX [Lachnospiraceae bacterium]|nr:conjugal transfer protein TraX [Lachnospiraceae bacterium]